MLNKKRVCYYLSPEAEELMNQIAPNQKSQYINTLIRLSFHPQIEIKVKETNSTNKENEENEDSQRSI